MCEFCLKHGEGKKWYLNAKNYADDLLSDIRRRRFIADFLSNTKALGTAARAISRISKAPMPLRHSLSHLITRKMKRLHFGQVLPIEEVEKVFEFVNSVIRVSCVCRHVTAKKEGRYCYGLSLAPNGGTLAEIIAGLDNSFLSGPESGGLEHLTKEEALSAIRAHGDEGLCHTVWTFQTPFICCICNCNSNDCLAMRATVTHGVAVMFRGEYVAALDSSRCTGCGKCLAACQFRALALQGQQPQAVVNQGACFGCGLCRNRCPAKALSLVERSAA